MKCDICGREFSRPVIELHRERCFKQNATTSQLRAMAKSRNIKIPKSSTREDILELLGG